MPVNICFNYINYGLQILSIAWCCDNFSDFISKRTKDALASAKARGVKLGGARPNQKARHDAVKKDADDLAKTVEPVIKAMRNSGNTWDQIAKHMNELSIPTARGGKWYVKTVLNAHQRLT